jgi:hypothetical protein
MHRGRSHTPTPARAAAARRYRNLVGIPGGTKSPLAKTLVAASTRTDDKLDFAVGKGACSRIKRRSAAAAASMPHAD